MLEQDTIKMQAGMVVGGKHLSEQQMVKEPLAEVQAVLVSKGGGDEKAEAESPPTTAWAVGVAGKPTTALGHALASLGVVGIANPPRAGRTCGVDSCLALICVSPSMPLIAQRAARIALQQRHTGGGQGLSFEDVNGFVASMHALALALKFGLGTVDSPLRGLRELCALRALELDAAADPDRLASLRRVLRAVAANAMCARVKVGAALHADADDAAGDDREWRVTVADALLDDLGVGVLLLVEHHDGPNGTVTRSTIGSPGAPAIGALLLRRTGDEQGGNALHYHAVLCNATELAKAIAMTRPFAAPPAHGRRRGRDKNAADTERALHNQAGSTEGTVRTGALELLQSMNAFEPHEKVRWMRGGGCASSKPVDESDVAIVVDAKADEAWTSLVESWEVALGAKERAQWTRSGMPLPAEGALAKAAVACLAASESAPCEHCGCPYAEQWGDAPWHCFECKKPLDADVRAAPEDAAKAAAVTLDAPLAVVEDKGEPILEGEAQHSARGVRVSFLEELLASLPVATRRTVTTGDLVARLIKPATVHRRCRFVELPAMVSHVGAPRAFVSHAWGAPFASLVAAVAHAIPQEQYVWIDILYATLPSSNPAYSSCA